MNFKIMVVLGVALAMVACNHSHKEHNHDSSEEHSHASHEGHEHDSHEADQDAHEHSDIGEHNEKVLIQKEHEHDDEEDNAEVHGHEAMKLQLTAYCKAFEVFAETDPFVVGQTSSILAHFSHIPSFKALTAGGVTTRLIIGDRVVKHQLSQPTRKGIYLFELAPIVTGQGKLIFEIDQKGETFQLEINVRVYSNTDEAFHAEESTISKVNTTSFTKEQSWKIDFATELSNFESFGQVIKTTGVIEPAQNDELIISAKTNGFVSFSGQGLIEGIKIKRGQVLFSILANGLANDNMSVRFFEARNNFEQSTQDYERLKALRKDNIIAEKELLAAETRYKNSKVIFENLQKGFDEGGQKVSSSVEGLIQQVHIKNGQYVNAGDPLFSVAQNKTLFIRADMQQKYAAVLSDINSATIHTVHNQKSFHLEELNGKIISYGNASIDNNHFLPLTLQVDKNENLIPGTFVELFLKVKSNKENITVPNSALLEQQGNFFLFVQINPELFEKRQVVLGATDGIRTEIVSGLSQSERVVTKGAVFIKLAQATGTLDAHSGHVH